MPFRDALPYLLIWEGRSSRAKVIWELNCYALFSHHLWVHVLQICLCRAQLCGDRKSRTNGHLFHQWDHRPSQDGPALTEQPWNRVHPLWQVGRKTLFFYKLSPKLPTRVSNCLADTSILTHVRYLQYKIYKAQLLMPLSTLSSVNGTLSTTDQAKLRKSVLSQPPKQHVWLLLLIAT